MVHGGSAFHHQDPKHTRSRSMENVLLNQHDGRARSRSTENIFLNLSQNDASACKCYKTLRVRFMWCAVHTSDVHHMFAAQNVRVARDLEQVTLFSESKLMELSHSKLSWTALKEVVGGFEVFKHTTFTRRQLSSNYTTAAHARRAWHWSVRIHFT